MEDFDTVGSWTVALVNDIFRLLKVLSYKNFWEVQIPFGITTNVYTRADIYFTINKEGKQEIQKKMSSLVWHNERKYALDAIPGFVIS